MKTYRYTVWIHADSEPEAALVLERVGDDIDEFSFEDSYQI